jgi:outer membrane protein assembly factor BamB
VTCYSGYGWLRGKGNYINEDTENQSKLRFHVACVDAKTGEKVWQRDLKPLGRVKEPNNNVALHGYASPTPYVDDEYLFVSFGTGGIFALDPSTGAERWRFVPGTVTHYWGYAASLTTCDGLLIINASSEANALIAVDRNTGEERWRAAEGLRTQSKWNRSWSTPLILERPGGGKQICLLVMDMLYSYNPDDGGVLWKVRTNQGYASNNPTWLKDAIYAVVGSSHGDAVSLCVKTDPALAPKERVLWMTPDKGANINSAVYHDGHLYWAAFAGGLRPPTARGFCCMDARTGEMVYQERLDTLRIGRTAGSHIYASTLCADSKLYYVSQTLGVFVVAATPGFKVLGHNKIEDDQSWFNASPVPLEGGRLLLRSDWGLHCIAKGG